MAKSKLNLDVIPVCLFLYNRSEFINSTLDAIKKSAVGENVFLNIFIDGPKNNEDRLKVSKVKELVDQYDFSEFLDVKIQINKTNAGLGESVISGVSKVIKQHKRVVVLEDDLQVSKNFFSYMKHALAFFADKKKIGSISGFAFGVKQKKDFDCYYHPRPTSWGWATWEDRWNKVDWDIDDEYLKLNKFSKNKFNSLGDDMTRMLRGFIDGKIDSWAIRWAYCHYKNGWLSVNPYKSKIINNGFGINNSTNTRLKNNFLVDFDLSNKKDFKYPNIDLFEKRTHRIVNFYNSNLIRLAQKYFPNLLWIKINKLIFKYF